MKEAEAQLRELVEPILPHEGAEEIDAFIAELKGMLLQSYRNGQKAGPRARTTAKRT